MNRRLFGKQFLFRISRNQIEIMASPLIPNQQDIKFKIQFISNDCCMTTSRASPSAVVQSRSFGRLKTHRNGPSSDEWQMSIWQTNLFESKTQTDELESFTKTQRKPHAINTIVIEERPFLAKVLRVCCSIGCELHCLPEAFCFDVTRFDGIFERIVENRKVRWIENGKFDVVRDRADDVLSEISKPISFGIV